jgi:DNA primase large subunit
VNRELEAGRVVVREEEKDELIRERIRVVLQRQLPLDVPGYICALLAPALESITTAHQASVLEQFGTIDEGSFPPCINALIGALTGGRNIPHTGRFALTAFLHTIGMDTNAIVELYCRAPDFDVGKTLYQVEHITGRGGTEYTAPSCAAMRTTGLCVNKNLLCTHVKHPLHYYRKKKKGTEEPPDVKKGSEDSAGEEKGSDGLHGGKKEVGEAPGVKSGSGDSAGERKGSDGFPEEMKETEKLLGGKKRSDETTGKKK